MFDEQPDGDPHGECAAEIHRLEAENAKLRAACADLFSVRDQFAKAAMQGCIASGRFMGYAACAADSYAMADAMMAARAAASGVLGTSGDGNGSV